MKLVYFCIPVSLGILVLNLSSPDYLGFSVPPVPSFVRGLTQKPAPAEKKEECSTPAEGGLRDFVKKQTGKDPCNSLST